MPTNPKILAELEHLKTRIAQRVGGSAGRELALDFERLVFAIVKDEALRLSPDFLDPFVAAALDRIQPTIEALITSKLRELARQQTAAFAVPFASPAISSK